MLNTDSPDLPTSDDYLDARQIAWFRDTLEAMRTEIDQDIINATQNAHAGLESGGDDGDRASRTLDAERIGQVLNSLSFKRMEVESALSRIDSGDFGYCQLTGDEIGLRRLRLLPTARYTVEAQERVEYRARQARQ